MKTRKCNLCDRHINDDSGVSFSTYDLCVDCTKLTRRAICRKCDGTGKIRIRDDKATDAQSSCGENRTQYKTVECKSCK